MMRRICLLACCLAASLSAGCGQSSGLSADAARMRSQFLLTEEPSDALGVTEAREALAAQPAATDDIVLYGKIPASPEPWTAGRALFLVTDPAAGGGEGEHEHVCSEGCPFCSAKQEASESLAVVEFVDESGKVLHHDARQLFGVEKNQIVVVSGKPRVDGTGALVISARGLYIRR